MQETNPLITAIMSENQSEIERLLSQGQRVRQVINRNGAIPGVAQNVLPLIVACYKENPEIVDRLLATPGIDLDAAIEQGRTHLRLAARRGWLNVLVCLLKIPGLWEMVDTETLRNIGIEIELDFPNRDWIIHEVRRWLDPLVIAIEDQNMGAVDEILSDPYLAPRLINRFGVGLPLIVACNTENPEIVDRLLATPGIALQPAVESGYWLLRAAILQCQPDTIRCLFRIPGMTMTFDQDLFHHIGELYQGDDREALIEEIRGLLGDASKSMILSHARRRPRKGDFSVQQQKVRKIKDKFIRTENKAIANTKQVRKQLDFFDFGRAGTRSRRYVRKKKAAEKKLVNRDTLISTHSDTIRPMLQGISSMSRDVFQDLLDMMTPSYPYRGQRYTAARQALSQHIPIDEPIYDPDPVYRKKLQFQALLFKLMDLFYKSYKNQHLSLQQLQNMNQRGSAIIRLNDELSTQPTTDAWQDFMRRIEFAIETITESSKILKSDRESYDAMYRILFSFIMNERYRDVATRFRDIIRQSKIKHSKIASKKSSNVAN